MITLNMTLFPQGIGLLRQGILEGTIWTTDDGKHHAYHIENDGRVFEGKFLKRFSGHKNPFRLLTSVIKDIEKNA